MAARARCAREARMNSDTVLGCLDGLLPVAEDWHTSVVLLNVVLQLFFKIINKLIGERAKRARHSQVCFN